ncbi:hypothetical protein QBC38DRAFT_458651 [Podospora fimiseda]|uniref:Uncharacterized protein n=1 Tax=Podospora fimiseda TaxID=252190 RepID=A0AAN7GWR6_9PEZI|nr:hypothetical protein QBC38DRAFT_458651 [Podospora fimiseda]
MTGGFVYTIVFEFDGVAAPYPMHARVLEEYERWRVSILRTSAKISTRGWATRGTGRAGSVFGGLVERPPLKDHPDTTIPRKQHFDQFIHHQQ